MLVKQLEERLVKGQLFTVKEEQLFRRMKLYCGSFHDMSESCTFTCVLFVLCKTRRIEL